jgi:hypothetical protein
MMGLSGKSRAAASQKIRFQFGTSSKSVQGTVENNVWENF